MKFAARVDADRADSGFTLIEVLIATAIFAIGIMAVASMQVWASLQNRSSTEITEASALASGQMEELMLRPFDHADLAAGVHQLNSGKYAMQWVVTESDLDGDGANDSKTVALTVSYFRVHSNASSQRQVSMFFIKPNQ
jgi:prepilin-type N-terminal cleavage/methylation domain-containing protein